MGPPPSAPAAAGRLPNITRVVRAVVRDAAERLPEFAHLKASRILVVAGEARRASWATIRPLGDGQGPPRPVVRIRGRKMLYVVTLRPRFFRKAGLEKRVETVLHELFHISRRFDGTLDAGRRHDLLGKLFERRLAPLVARYLAQMPANLREALSFRGLVKARQWLERPGLRPKDGRAGRRIYTEKQLFLGVLEMRTPTRRRRS